MEQPATEPEPEEPKGPANEDAESCDEDTETEDAIGMQKPCAEGVDSEGEDAASECEESAEKNKCVTAADSKLEGAAPVTSLSGPSLKAEASVTSKWSGLRKRLSRGRARFGATASEQEQHGDLLLGDESHSEAGEGEGGPVIRTEPSENNVEAWQVVDREGVVLAEVEGECSDPLAKRSVEAKVEQLLTWMLAPAVHGIPKLGVPGAVDRADELLAMHGRDLESAVREVVAGSETSVSALVLNFCLERIPILGCPTVLCRMTWGNLRSILIIAALYGHDLEAPRVQHEALLCLVPQGEDNDMASPLSSKQEQSTATMVSDTAGKVARMMIKSAVRRATGLQAAVDCFELASLLYSSVSNDSTDEDGFVHVTATPASTARDFFRRKSMASCALLWCSLPLLVLGSIAPVVFSFTRVFPVAFHAAHSLCQQLPRGCRDSLPALVLALVGVGISLRTFYRLAAPGRQRRRSPWRRLLVYLRGRHETQMLEEAWPQIVTALVFTLHAALPAASTFSAVSVILNSWYWPEDDPLKLWGWDILHRLSTTALGFYSLFSIMLHQLQGVSPEEEQWDERIIVRYSRRALLILVAAARGCCVLAAWTYASLALDFVLTRVAQGVGLVENEEQTSLLGVVRPLAGIFGAELGFGSLYNERALAFTLHLVGVASQQRLVELLSRREVLLRLIGAEKMMASTLCLLLKGVAVACSVSKSNNPISEFLTSVAPPPLCCVLIVAVREQALLLGATLVLAPKVVSSGILGSTPCFILGISAGGYAANALLSLWYANRAELESPGMRLIFLIPGGVSSRAKGLFRGALAGARTRAVQMMAMGVIQRVVRWWRSPRY